LSNLRLAHVTSNTHKTLFHRAEAMNHLTNHGVGNRTPNEAFLSFAVLTKNEALTV